MRVALGLLHYEQMLIGNLAFGLHFHLSLLDASLDRAFVFIPSHLWVLEEGLLREAALLRCIWDMPQMPGQPCPAPRCWGQMRQALHVGGECENRMRVLMRHESQDVSVPRKGPRKQKVLILFCCCVFFLVCSAR